MKLWKKTAFFLSLTLLAGAAESAPGPFSVSASSATREKINRAEQEKNALQQELNRTQENLEQLEGQRDTLQGELNYLRGQMDAVVANLEELERRIDEKQQQIADTQATLEEAKETERQQYENMEVVVRCMYEQQEDSYLTMLLTTGSLAEILNRADRIEKVVAYDRKMLEEYKENRILIEEHEARLLTEMTDLEKLQAEAEAERDKVNGMIESTAGSISRYAGQISDAERQALDYEAKLKEKEKDLDYLRQKLAEEIAMSQAAANGVWRNISDVSFAESDRKLLANLIYCEAGGEPYDGQVAVGSVVINRVLSSKYPDTVVGVIYQSGQFSPVGSGRLELALAADIATDACYRAADEAMSGITNVGTCVYFRTPIEGLEGIRIGGHVFY